MTRPAPAIIVIAIIVTVGAFLTSRLMTGGSTAPTQQDAQAPLQYVNEDLDKFVEDFNAATGQVRLVFVVGPSCAVCLRGLDDMNRKIAAVDGAKDGLEIFILYVPALGGQEQHAQQATRLISSGPVHHYWDDSGISGRIFQQALDIGQYAWDVWMIYGRDAQWRTDDVPGPQYWAHQLQGLAPDRHLNPDRFAKAVVSALADEDIVTGDTGRQPG